jgi:deoxyribose-phosphate aldolase
MGATELDVVPNIGAYLGGDIELAETEIRTLSDTAKRLGAKAVKVIIETGYMTERQIEELSLMIVDAGADYVKTSTGYGPRGASVRDIEIIRNVVGGKAKIKAAGGIRTLDQAIELIKAGASVLGTSSAKSLVEEASRRAS